MISCWATQTFRFRPEIRAHATIWLIMVYGVPNLDSWSYVVYHRAEVIVSWQSSVLRLMPDRFAKLCKR